MTWTGFNSAWVGSVSSGKKALLALIAKDNLSMDPAYWNSSLITSLWVYTKNLWHFRNQFIHGSSVEELATIIILDHLQQHAIHHYKQYNINPGYLLQCHHHLFQKPLQDKLKLPYDHLSCWLRSVDEARSILLTQDAHLQSTAHSFFSMFTSTRGPGTSSDSQ
jgi:hypothetical protein